MDTADIIQSIKSIEVESPTNKIIQQLKQLITTGSLKPGDRLPAERVLAEKLGVGRWLCARSYSASWSSLACRRPSAAKRHLCRYSIKMIEGVLTDDNQFQ